MLMRLSKRALTISVAWGFFSVWPTVGLATTISDSYCNMGDLARSERQTILVIDGASIEPEAKGAPSASNRAWRRFAISYADASRPQISARMAPREHLTLAVANADGSGVSILFQGCVPFYSESEKERLSNDSAGAMGSVSAFFGGGWKASQTDAAEEFREDFELSLVQGVSELSQQESESGAQVQSFSDSGLARSLAQSGFIDLSKGVPRIIVYGDLDAYQYLEDAVVSARRAGRDDAEKVGLDLKGSEIHLFGLGKKSSARSISNYLKAFFLSGKALVETLTSTSGSLNSNRVPATIQTFQGTSQYPDGKYPTKLRLVRDSSNAVFNSWVEVQSDRTRFVPFEGILLCKEKGRCEYSGNRTFAQIWSDNPDPSPEFEQWMPFAGFRNFEFVIEEGTLTGSVSDSAGTLVGSEDDRFTLELKAMENATLSSLQ